GEAADRRPVQAGTVQGSGRVVGCGVHAHRGGPQRRPSETGEVRGDGRHVAGEGGRLRLPHRGVQGEGVQQEQPVRHLGTTTDSAAGTTLNVAGSVPAYSPSANTWNSRSAAISITLPSSMVTAGCVT